MARKKTFPTKIRSVMFTFGGHRRPPSAFARDPAETMECAGAFALSCATFGSFCHRPRLEAPHEIACGPAPDLFGSRPGLWHRLAREHPADAGGPERAGGR